MRVAVVCGVVVWLLALPIAQAECVVSTGIARAHLIELYTSEGCSSCPPAERWLSGLPASDALIPLAFHVDYWDSPAWSDRFANPLFTQRQQALAHRSGSSTVYTPEVAVDGREWRAWSGGKLPIATTPALVALTLHIDVGSVLHARLDATPASPAADYSAWFALSEDKLVSSVRGGENRGVELHHDHVVRRFIGPLPLPFAQTAIDVPADLSREQASVSAFVQRGDDGEIVNVVQLALRSCVDAGGDQDRPRVQDDALLSHE